VAKIRYQRVDTDSLGDDIDTFYESLTKALDAADEAGRREAALKAASEASRSGRFGSGS
jgi:hypothetical protein